MDVARRSSFGVLTVGSMLAEPKPSSPAATEPARPTVPHSAAANVANRRGVIAPPSPPVQGPTRATLHSQARDGTDFSNQVWRDNGENGGFSFFFRVCCLNATHS